MLGPSDTVSGGFCVSCARNKRAKHENFLLTVHKGLSGHSMFSSNTHTHTHTHTHIYIYIYVWVCACVCVCAIHSFQPVILQGFLKMYVIKLNF